MTTSRPIKRVRAGLYEHPSGYMIVRTEGWEGPRGGDRILWEIGVRDSDGQITVGIRNHPIPSRTLREARAELDA